MRTLINTLAARLLAERTAAGFWAGRLSSSALSTAVAAFALARVNRTAHAPAVAAGLDWLARHANADGGWGDTTDSPSNLSTTLLAWSALAAEEEAHAAPVQRAADWIRARAGSLAPDRLAAAVLKNYGDDRTFSAPILTFCALAGRLGPEPAAWTHVPQLPFELAALPRQFFAALRLPVVSYALPALIAIGLVRQARAARRCPGCMTVRGMVTGRVLRLLAAIQPSSGGFLEAAPLTGFVAVSLASAGRGGTDVIRRATEFLRATQRDDGSWPIDTDLSVWLTTGAARALFAADPAGALWPAAERAKLRAWLLDRQYRRPHLFTGAAPGGWGWSDRPGAVPDADDTAGALLALRALGPVDTPARAAAVAGVRWLLALQNRDGGFPTFCRGWGRLPFDRSTPDLTAHALRALTAWDDVLSKALRGRAARARRRALAWLARVQNTDGSWTPLWFGNQSAPGGENRTYGTALVLRALETAQPDAAVAPMRTRAIAWLAAAQNADGGWGGAKDVASSVEETALAFAALASTGHREAVIRGRAWLAAAWSRPTAPAPAPIGLYFASLWYSERLYPLIFSLGAIPDEPHVSETGSPS